MSQQKIALPPLALSRTPMVGDYSFAGDMLGRRELGERLTGYIDRLREGAVLAIDAPWGEGKTWFGRNWARHLEDQGHRVVFIDAFEQDYIEDPFLLITAEISQVLDDGHGAAQGLRQKAAEVMKAILPLGTKVMINLAGRIAIGSSDLTGEFKTAGEAARDGATDMAGKWIEKKFKDFAQDKASLQYFRTELAKFAAVQGKPVVLFIDELDRCRPDFAVRLIERVKHFFDVPNLVFVLLLNRDQIEKAVKGIYGSGTDATAYLGKFVNFFFRLPKRTSIDRYASDHVKGYITHVFKRYNFEHADGHKNFIDVLSFMSTPFNLSLRDIERAFALYAFAQPLHFASALLAYVIAIKLAKPRLYHRLVKGEVKAHEEAKTIIDKLNQTVRGPGRLLTIISEWHEAHISSFKNVGEHFQQYQSNLWHFTPSPEQLFASLAGRIDLPMED